MSFRLLAKLVLLGDGGVGKSSIRESYLGKPFTGRYLETLGADFALVDQPVIINDVKYKVRFQIWDLAGQQRFTSVRKEYYNGSIAAIIVYDISRIESLQNIDKWVTESLKNLINPPSFFLIANKIDLREELGKRAISTEQGIKIRDKLQERLQNPVHFLETSAKTGENVRQIFVSLAELIVNSMIDENNEE